MQETPTSHPGERKPPGPLDSLFDRLRRIRHIEWIAVLLVGGLIIATLSMSFTPKSPSDVFITSADPSAAATEQEVQLEQVLAKLKGVGAVRVMIAYEDEPAAFGASARKKPVGAIVVAEGADDIAVRLELVQAVRTVLNLPAQSVDVFSMGE